MTMACHPGLNLPSFLAGIVLLSVSSSAAELREYCFPSKVNFNATCLDGEVVVMETARYGRMRKGRCLTQDIHVGCSADVLSHVDRKCSGRHSCGITIPDTELHSLQPCPKDMMAYMEAAFSCVRVEHRHRGTCQMNHGVQTSQPSGYIANLITEEHGLGSPRCPWVIHMEPGQRVNITLLDFGVTSRFTEAGSMCHVYARISERGMASEVTICGGSQRERNVYISETNHVEVQILSFKREKMPIYFLLKYEAIGCTDPYVPVGAWLQRSGANAKVSCNYTTQTWHIVCYGNSWSAQVDNCTVGSARPKSDTLSSNKGGFPYGLLVAVVTGVVLGVLIGIALLSVVMVCHKRSKKATRGATTHQGEAQVGSPFLDGDHSKTYHQGAPESCYGYTHIGGGVRVVRQVSHDSGYPRAYLCDGTCDAAKTVSVKSSHDYEKPGWRRAGETQSPEGGTAGPMYHDFDPAALDALRRNSDDRTLANF